MSAWMIGLGLAGMFAGAVAGWLRELSYDWNGGTTKKGAALRFAKATAAGALLGTGIGWLVTDDKSKEDVIIEKCFKEAPAGKTVTVTNGPNGVVCAYKP